VQVLGEGREPHYEAEVNCRGSFLIDLVAPFQALCIRYQPTKCFYPLLATVQSAGRMRVLSACDTSAAVSDHRDVRSSRVVGMFQTCHPLSPSVQFSEMHIEADRL
jgi:hypothetical protein